MAEEVKKTETKAYTSPIYPNHRIGTEIKFVNGIYSTASKVQQKAIESDPLFGIKIFENK